MPVRVKPVQEYLRELMIEVSPKSFASTVIRITTKKLLFQPLKFDQSAS